MIGLTRWFLPVLYSTLVLSLLHANSTHGSVFAGELQVTNLRCNHLSEAFGIDSAQPELSWRITSDERDVAQAAYQVIVADSLERLSMDEGNVWDSGRVDSNESKTLFDGEVQLASDCRYYWKVRVWGRRGRLSPWSKTGRWSMGLLKLTDWMAEWIGADRLRERPLQRSVFDGSHWIASASETPLAGSAGRRLYVYRFNLPDDVTINKAQLFVVADDHLELVVNEETVLYGERGWARVSPRDVVFIICEGATTRFALW